MFTEKRARPAHVFKVVAAITGRRSSTHSFKRRPMIASTIHSRAASGNRGGFFCAAPCRKWQFRLSMYPDPKHRTKKLHNHSDIFL
jgi:hypothetical protein